MVANNAGMPATPADLINVDEVIGKYYDVVPDPNVPEQRVSFGTSGHRGSSLKTSFNEPISSPSPRPSPNTARRPA